MLKFVFFLVAIVTSEISNNSILEAGNNSTSVIEFQLNATINFVSNFTTVEFNETNAENQSKSLESHSSTIAIVYVSKSTAQMATTASPAVTDSPTEVTPSQNLTITRSEGETTTEPVDLNDGLIILVNHASIYQISIFLLIIPSLFHL